MSKKEKGVLEDLVNAIHELTKAIKELKLEVLPISPQSPVIPSAPSKPSISPAPSPTQPKLLLVGHDVIIEKTPKAKTLADFVQRFAKLNRASRDVLVFTIDRLSLWKAAERHTADEVIEFLKLNAKSPPPDSLKRWISRQMSMWDQLHIKSKENFDYLEAADEKLMDRILSMREVKSHIFRRLTPTTARIIQGHRGELKQTLLEKGYPIKDLGRYEEFPPLKYELKPEVTQDPRYQAYQKEAVEEFLKYGSGTIVLPGGSGKTVIAVMVAAKLQAPTLVLVTRAEIAEQFKKEFLTKTTISSYNVACIHGQSRDRTVKPITICTYQIASSGSLARELWNRKWGLVVYDESQHIPGKIWSRTTRIQAIRRLGLTATPIREDKQEKLIFSLIGPGVYEKGWVEMAEEGFIAKAKAYEVLVDMPERIARRYSHTTDEREKYILASTNPGKLPIVKKLLQKHEDDKVLILGYYVQGALELGKKLGIPVIYGEVSAKQRHTLYNKFRNGEIKRLILTSVGEEGVDLPDANVLIEVCGLYGSRMQMGQRFGRILRPKKKGSIFYEIVSRGTMEEDFSQKRRAFLISKGYEFSSLEVNEL